MRVQTPLSLTGVFQRDPRPSSEAALQALQQGGPLPAAPQMLEAAAKADGLCDVSRQMLYSFADSHGELPVNEVCSLLQKAGLKEVSQGDIGVNYEHHFEMNYGANGGFRGSRSYNSPGETSLARVTAYQEPGSAAGAVHVQYSLPGHVGPRIEGTIFDDLSGANSLFFTSDLGQVQGLTGTTMGDDQACKQRLEQLFTSLDGASPVQLHNYTSGYGRVGTSYHQGVRVDGQDVSGDPSVAGAAAGLRGMQRLLEVSGALVPAPEVPENASKISRILGGLALGGAAAAVGTMLGGLHPLVGLGLAGATIAGTAAFGRYSHREDPRDFPLPTGEALQQRNQARATRGLHNGLLLGAALSGSALAGAALGWPGVGLAAGACAGAEALLSLAD